MIFSLEKFEEKGLEGFRKKISLDEEIDYQCIFVTAKDKSGALAGLCGFNLEKEKYPKFVHILIAPKHQRTRLLIILAGIMEKFLAEKGHQFYVSYILHANKKMRTYAQKWGMKELQPQEDGSWFFKPLMRIEENVQLNTASSRN